jgi:hypothetical protein
MRLREQTSARETRKLETLIRNRPFPTGISAFDIEYGEDPSGDPAVWIWFHHENDPKVSRSRIRELSLFLESVQMDILRRMGTQPFPYVGLRSKRAASGG